MPTPLYPITAAAGGEALDETQAAALRTFEDMADGAYAPKTLFLLESVARAFSRHVAAEGWPPFPEAAEAVVSFTNKLAETQKPSTIRTKLAALSSLYQAAGFSRGANPVTSKLVQVTYRKISRVKGARQRRAYPLYGATLRALLAACDNSPAGLRDRALLTLASACLLRQSEVAALTLADVFLEADGTGSIFIRRSKCDQAQEGVYLPISEAEVERLLAYLRLIDPELAGFGDDAETLDPLFRPLSKSGRLLRKPLSARSVAYIVRRIAKRAGLDPALIRQITGHSLRRGTATEMLDAGVPVPEILQAGRWTSRSDMLSRYTSDRVIRRGALESRRALLARRESAHEAAAE